ncbi:MAG: riboflavin synthase [Endomicrobium sp.]|jgi:riboflavin synthase|nr:riboflavin synthase [Endomicrobium sp.]
MFTGLIEDVGIIKSISDSKIEIKTNLDNIKKGDSISVNGVCLTAIFVNKNSFIAEYSSNTSNITNFSRLKKKSKINLERSLKCCSRFGGHVVSGHVDGIAKIKFIEKVKQFYKIIFSCEKNITDLCVNKGSIAVDGVSLTISSVSILHFETFIIPETFNNTIMQFKKNGDEVNIEVDIFAKYIRKFINENNTNKKDRDITIEMLNKTGFA